MKLLSEREKTHGDYNEVARVAQELKASLGVGRQILPFVHAESLDLICTKMARIVCGNCNEPDHWTDIIGYSKLALKTINAVPPGSTTNGTPDEPKDPSIGDDWDYNPRSGLSR